MLISVGLELWQRACLSPSDRAGCPFLDFKSGAELAGMPSPANSVGRRSLEFAHPAILGQPSPPWGLPEWAVIAQVAGPAVLYLPGTQVFRVPLRFSVFSISLLGFILCLQRGRLVRSHPAWKPLMIAAVYMTLMIFHPTTNSTMAGLAQIVMHLAVVAPIFWVPNYFLGDFRRLTRMLAILWVLNGASTVVGILQIRDPSTWLPAEFSSVESGKKGRIASLQYRTSDNRTVVRPPGLGDAPGAACGAGMFVASVGLAYLGLPVSNWRKIFGMVMGAAGVSVIFLTHVRSSLLILIGSAFIFAVVMAVQKRFVTLLVFLASIGACGIGSFLYASSVGGRDTVDRFTTLVENDPMTVLERSGRLGMTANALDTLIIDYPFGAGLGRWGMMRYYFGDENNLASPSIWSEVQLASWVLDGGLILLSLYSIALAATVLRLIRLSLWGQSDLIRQWGGVILMLSAAPIALTFSYTPFNSQGGVQFWLLISAFEGAYQSRAGMTSSLGVRSSLRPS